MLLHAGESEGRDWRVTTIDDVVQRLFEAAPAVDGRPRVVAIDGRGGAGKSTLAERLRDRVPGSALVHTDDIAWHHAMFDWGSELAENVLRPLHRGAEVKFRGRLDRGHRDHPTGTGLVDRPRDLCPGRPGRAGAQACRPGRQCAPDATTQDRVARRRAALHVARTTLGPCRARGVWNVCPRPRPRH
jgi:hypothetical protein